jgi:DNA-binding beta-propeller fold protein YncE
LIYISFVTGSRLGVYEYGDNGELSFVGMASNGGKLICWVAINKAGTRAYTTNNASDTLSVYDLSNPRKPVEIKTVELKGHGHPYQLALSSDGEWLYIVKHRTFDETPIGDGSVMNVLKVAPDGSVVEAASSPITLPVRDDLSARPQGVAAH